MRTLAWAFLPILLASTACDKDEKSKAQVDSVTGDSAAPVVSAVPASAPPVKEAGAPAASVAMPERPIPKPQTMVSSGASEEIQMKASGYMVAMRAPHLDDAPADEAYAADLVTKLKPVVLAMDHGPDKAKWNRVEMVAKGRQIDLLRSDGCDAKAPFNAVTQRLNVPLATLLSHGILVVRCNDTKRQCLQSVRDPDDVLCTTAPRHK
ncbi:MAG: hypothetical protein K0S65_944 [Labilithrix sp.]|nr:hypothetical protein [Labilithrix sp.]